jgi:DNA mismatch repair protein MutL
MGAALFENTYSTYNPEMVIAQLPPEVASQIAAGEVIERPASVIKELVENALDAGARTIHITAEGAGKKLLEVADDGCGIPAEELPLAVLRHATSKLRSAAELFQISSLGFRGEALSSVGSVSTMTITSKVDGSHVGGRIRIESGIAGPVEQVGAPTGTTVRVENLFSSVPARLKFLKSDSTERGQIDALVTRYALANPNVRFLLKQEGRTSLQTAGAGDRRAVLASMYGVETARQMLEVLAEYEDLQVSGYISPLTVTRSHRREITLFVNRRPVQDAALSAAIIQAYHNLLMVGRFPLAAVFIEINPEAVDVNVHPAKAEVRFRERDRVFSGVQRAVRRALLAHTPAPEISPARIWGTFPPDQQSTDQRTWDYPSEPDQAGPDSQEAGFTGQTVLPSGRMPLLRLIGQVAQAYLIAEGPDGLYLIDQHAAHERVLFEKLMTQMRGQVASQALLQPAAVQLPAAQARLLEEKLGVLQEIGFQVETFGPETFLVRSMPALLSKLTPEEALRVVVEDFEEDETPLAAETETLLIARVCKRAAVKAGQTLSIEEQRSLIQDLEACQSPRTCPHGRPTMIHLSVDILERQFGRRGAR